MSFFLLTLTEVVSLAGYGTLPWCSFNNLSFSKSNNSDALNSSLLEFRNFLLANFVQNPLCLRLTGNMTTTTQLKGSQNYIWSMLDVLGQGATGAVYKARHKVRDISLLLYVFLAANYMCYKVERH